MQQAISEVVTVRSIDSMMYISLKSLVHATTHTFTATMTKSRWFISNLCCLSCPRILICFCKSAKHNGHWSRSCLTGDRPVAVQLHKKLRRHEGTAQHSTWLYQ